MIRLFNQYVSLKTLTLVVLESLLICGSLLLGIEVRFWNDPAQFSIYTKLPDCLLQFAIVVGTLQSCFYYNDLYNLSSFRRRSHQIIRVVQGLGAGFVLLGLFYVVVPSLLIGRGILFIASCVAVSALALNRIVLDGAWHISQNVIILGGGESAVTVARELSRRTDLALHLAGLLSAQPPVTDSVFGYRILGGPQDLQRIVEEHKISRIILAMEDYRGTLPVRDLVTLRVKGVYVEDAHSAMAALTGRVLLNTVRPSWFLFSEGFRRSSLTTLLKRISDIGFSVFGILVSAPIMILVAIAIKLDSKGPIFYSQERVGHKERPFQVSKFRSMRTDAEVAKGAAWAEKNDPRVTRVGGFIRKYRLDELPQFFDILRGDMSLVGPRPERPYFVKMLEEQLPFYAERHSARPGLTGWAQINQPYGSSVEDAMRKLEYDLFYLKNVSLLFDYAILFDTVRIVFQGRGGR